MLLNQVWCNRLKSSGDKFDNESLKLTYHTNMNAIWVPRFEIVSGFPIRVIGCSTKVSLGKFNCDWTFFTHKIDPFFELWKFIMFYSIHVTIWKFLVLNLHEPSGYSLISVRNQILWCFVCVHVNCVKRYLFANTVTI